MMWFDAHICVYVYVVLTNLYQRPIHTKSIIIPGDQAVQETLYVV